MHIRPSKRDLEEFGKIGRETFPGFVGVEILETGKGFARARLEIRPHHLAPNGYLHAGAVVSLGDTTCGYGCMANLPKEATGFATIELKTNFLGTARGGSLTCSATRVHSGGTTQVWDATVDGPEGRGLALFRCTQLLLYERRDHAGAEDLGIGSID